VPSFYARGDTATPVRATITAVAANIAMKFLLVMGLDLGVFGLALGTSLGAWTNLAVLTYLARRRAVLVATPELKRGIAPVLAAAAAAAAGFFAGDVLGESLLAPSGGFRELIAFLIAGSSGAAAFAIVVLSFRRKLPLGAH
jgi:putative peptidoglycan lipid II flippase